MKPRLFAHPFSSYSQKVLIALYENEVPFEYRILSPKHADNGAEHATIWPLRKFPVLVDGKRHLIEASLIIEYLDLHFRGNVRFIPADRDAALDVRFMDRFFDNYIMTPTQAIVGDWLRPEDRRDPYGVKRAREQLDAAYAWLDTRMHGRTWACGDAFTLADCAAAPSLFYADWVNPIEDRFATVAAFRQRLLARPSFARAVDEARPYRELFPPGAPDRD